MKLYIIDPIIYVYTPIFCERDNTQALVSTSTSAPKQAWNQKAKHPTCGTLAPGTQATVCFRRRSNSFALMKLTNRMSHVIMP